MAEASPTENDDNDPLSMLSVISKQLDCPICTSRLTDPKDLDCSHTFCSQCLADYSRSQKVSTIISCPICRQNTVLPPGGISYLKTNYLLRDVIDAIPVEDSDPDARRPKPRTSLHLKDTVTQTCGVHNGVLRDIYCATCNVLVCSKCIGTGHCAIGHSHYSLSKRAAYARNYLKTLSCQSKEKLADLDSMLEEINRVEDMLQENRENTLTYIAKHVQDIVSKVMQQQTTIVNKVDERFDEDTQLLINERARITKMRDRLQKYHKDVEKTANNHDDETVALLESKLDSEKSSHPRQELNLQCSEFEFEQSDVTIGRLIVKSEQVKRKAVRTQRSWKMTKEVPGRGFQNGVAVSSDGTTLGVCKSSGVYLYLLDCLVPTWFRHIQGTSPECLKAPQDLVFLNDDNIVILDATSTYARIFTQQGAYVDKFATLEPDAFDHHRRVKVKLASIGYDSKHGVIVIGDIGRKALTFHQNDGTILQTIYLDNIAPISVDIDVNTGLVAVTSLVGLATHILSMTGKTLLVFERYGDTNWPLLSITACFCNNAESIFILRSMPLGEKSVLQYAIPSGKFMGCLYKGFKRPSQMVFYGNNKLAIADAIGVKILMGEAESEL